MRAPARLLRLGAIIQRRTGFEKRRRQLAVELVGLLLELDKRPTLQRRLFRCRQEPVQQPMKHRRYVFPSLLPIHQP